MATDPVLSPSPDYMLQQLVDGTTQTLSFDSTASTNATTVKTTAGAIMLIQCFNAVASARYLKLYNKASNPVPATDVPVATIRLPPSDSREVLLGSRGSLFPVGIAFVITANPGDADVTAIGAKDVKLKMDFT